MNDGVMIDDVGVFLKRGGDYRMEAERRQTICVRAYLPHISYVHTMVRRRSLWYVRVCLLSCKIQPSIIYLSTHV